LIILGIIFIAINIMGIMFGYQHAFFHEKSDDNYRISKRYKRQDNLKQNAMDVNEEALQHVGSKAKWFFDTFHNKLLTAADDNRLDNIEQALEDRHPLIFQEYLNYNKNTAGQTAQASTGPGDTPPDQPPIKRLTHEDPDTVEQNKPDNVVPLAKQEGSHNPDKPEMS
jgi:hypothetical protein